MLEVISFILTNALLSKITVSIFYGYFHAFVSKLIFTEKYKTLFQAYNCNSTLERINWLNQINLLKFGEKRFSVHLLGYNWFLIPLLIDRSYSFSPSGYTQHTVQSTL